MSSVSTCQTEAQGEGLTPTALGALTGETPFLACDTSVAGLQLRELSAHLPGFAIHYAVKCNPTPQVLTALAGKGCRFEVASIGELAMVEAIGTAASEVLFSNPVKPPAAIAEAHRRGLTRFAFDSECEVRKLATHAPGSRVYVRLAVDDTNSRFPLSRKFGADLEEAERLLLLARDLGLVPYGVTFHVGSQCTDPSAWPRAIRRCGDLFEGLSRNGIVLEMLDIGGGFPVEYTEPTPALASIAVAIRAAIDQLPYAPKVLVAEPGRFLAAGCGVMVASVIGLADRADGRWAYLDVGGYHGMMEAVQTGGQWQFPLHTSRPESDSEPHAAFTVTGPTCDASDTLFYGASLPEKLEVGDRVYIGMAGAYSLSYASAFNGFPPPVLVLVDGDRAT